MTLLARLRSRNLHREIDAVAPDCEDTNPALHESVKSYKFSQLTTCAAY
jgi:hypothetical protein